MTRSSEPQWGLDELGARVARALAVDYAGQASGRVRDVPDGRTIRYYTTLGLVDRPSNGPSGRGRAALYGWRHLLQLVAIKRLQAQGLALAEVQARLLGQTDAALEALARPAPGWDAEDVPAAARREAAFWKEPPAASAAEPLVGVPLAEGVTLLVRAARPLEGPELAALRDAAAPLLKFLAARQVPGAPANEE
jgi:DNA-binding transcriptional MerR regulator